MIIKKKRKRAILSLEDLSKFVVDEHHDLYTSFAIAPTDLIYERRHMQHRPNKTQCLRADVTTPPPFLDVVRLQCATATTYMSTEDSIQHRDAGGALLEVGNWADFLERAGWGSWGQWLLGAQCVLTLAQSLLPPRRQDSRKSVPLLAFETCLHWLSRGIEYGIQL